MSTNHQRDADMDRLLRAVLKPVSHAEAGECPDAAVLAAFVEGGLSDEERHALDDHFVRCGRCQEALAVVARHVPPEEEAAPRLRWFTWVTRPRLRWLIPVTAAATVAVLFVATRPLIAPGGLAPDEQGMQLAQAPPPPPSSLEQTGARQPKRDTAAAPSAKQAPEASSRLSAEPRRADQVTAPAQAANAPAPAGVPVGEATLSKAAPVDAATNLAARREVDDKKAGVAAELPAPQLAAAPAAAGAKAPADSREKMVVADAARVVPMSVPKPEELRSRDSTPPTVLAPGGTVRWRLGPAGEIWRSGDAGSTWHPQASGVSIHLLAGSAPSLATCWAVGADGTVLLTRDGERWERRPFPFAVDLTAVQAIDARVAAVTTRDGRRFETIDGGATWSSIRD